MISMEIIVFLSIVIAVVAVLTSIVLVRRVKKQIAEMTDVLVDVKNGNGNRRILSATNELTAPLAYEINEIVADRFLYMENGSIKEEWSPEELLRQRRFPNSIMSYDRNQITSIHLERYVVKDWMFAVRKGQLLYL